MRPYVLLGLLCFAFTGLKAQDTNYVKRHKMSLGFFIIESVPALHEDGLTKKYAEEIGHIGLSTTTMTYEGSLGFSLSIERIISGKWHGGFNVQYIRIQEEANCYYDLSNYDLHYSYAYTGHYLFTGFTLSRALLFLPNTGVRDKIYLSPQIAVGARGELANNGEIVQFQYNEMGSLIDLRVFDITKNESTSSKLYMDFSATLRLMVYSFHIGVGVQNFNKHYYRYDTIKNGWPATFTGISETWQKRFVIGFTI